ncbi:hypothetical protein E2562_031177 [Oryza meyeriana var. granulata]|uniref:Uncharacterized protein n=1 Tax=Oryza meyeriana var. granulata TaxID=110450 RepID=A0A6G1ECH0_9ORYZ|nr:hypothetical protein E2562_031177 [Oryza meyeriana var. granulata]
MDWDKRAGTIQTSAAASTRAASPFRTRRPEGSGQCGKRSPGGALPTLLPACLQRRAVVGGRGP